MGNVSKSLFILKKPIFIFFIFLTKKVVKILIILYIIDIARLDFIRHTGFKNKIILNPTVSYREYLNKKFNRS